MNTERIQAYTEKGDTWPRVLKYNYEKYGDRRTAMRYKQFGIWQTYTWQDYYLNVKHLALALLSFGLQPGDKLLIIGDNTPEWYYAELAVQSVHGIAVGMYADLTPSEIHYIAENSEARFAMVQDQEQVDKFLQIKDKLPLLQKVIYWEYKGLSNYDQSLLIRFSHALQSGQTYGEEHPGIFEQNIESGSADDICSLVYTSGTTGTAPKGAVHSFRTMRPGADFHLSMDPWHEDDNVILYLPPAWITEQWFGIGCHLLSGSILNFPERPETQQQDVREIGPDMIFCGVRLWESQAATIQSKILGASGVKGFTLRRFMPVGYKMADLKFNKQRPGILRKLLYFLTDKVLFRPIRDHLGLVNARICYTNGAILSPDACRFYHALNIPLKNIYGTTEGGALTGARTEDISPDTVGTIHSGAEVKITDEGEIVYRGSGVFLGYYKNPEMTAEVLKDGWFHSGDSGYINDAGHLVFLDRLNDIMELANGEKLAPQYIESRLKFSPYIKDAWILAGPQKAYTTAIIIINFENVGKWADQRKVAYTTFTDLSQKPEIYGLIKKDIDRINESLTPGLRVKKYVNLHKEFDPDEAELTRTRKLRRPYLEERYSDLIDAVYSDKSTVPIEAQVRYRDGRMGTIKTTITIKSIEEAG
jgi:long-chain acyl-CoA synthetase